MKGRYISNSELERIGEEYRELINQYMSYRYSIRLWWDGYEWVAEVEDLPGCVSVGDTEEAALAGIKDAKYRWFLLALHAGVKPPPPKEVQREDTKEDG